MRGTWKPGGVTHVARRIKMLLVLAAACALAACGGGGGSSTVNTALLVGTFAINLSGGQVDQNSGGPASIGGTGGKFIAYSSARSDLKIHAGGSVDASFTVPAYSYNFGGNPVINPVATNGVIDVKVITGTAAQGVLYMHANDTNLYLGTGTGTDNPVTGLTVPAGTTMNFDANFGTGTQVTLINAVVINGTVQPSTATTPNLALTAGSLQINAGGKVTAAAKDLSATNGGNLTLVTTNGVVVNQGTIDCSGTNGGSAGNIVVHARTLLFNATNGLAGGSGTISARGGDNAGGAGGTGGVISLFADAGSFCTSGIVDVSGGNATQGAGNGGAAGSIQFVAGDTAADTVPDANDTIGKVAVEGTVTANGGNAAAGNGGNGGTITQISHAQPLLANVAIIGASGGNGGGAGSRGGDGGGLNLFNLLAFDPATGLNASPQGIKVAGPISLNGGTGTSGGNGGTIFVKSKASPNALPGSATVEFFGYGFGINLNGGKGSLVDPTAGGTGGDGGMFAASLASAVTDGVTLPAGGVYNEVTITARGGDSAKGASLLGGAGGIVTMQSPIANNTVDPNLTVVVNSGAIDVSGGAGGNGGTAGTVTMSGYGKVTNSGSITGLGGDGTSQGGNGAKGVVLSAAIDITNSGFITISGGNASSGTGGKGGSVQMTAGHQTVNGSAFVVSGTISSAVSANGGAGTVKGGDGGSINLLSQTIATSNLGTLSAVGGGGATIGGKGTIVIDGVNIAI